MKYGLLSSSDDDEDEEEEDDDEDDERFLLRYRLGHSLRSLSLFRRSLEVDSDADVEATTVEVDPAFANFEVDGALSKNRVLPAK